jgi:hypothetical protein
MDFLHGFINRTWTLKTRDFREKMDLWSAASASNISSTIEVIQILLIIRVQFFENGPSFDLFSIVQAFEQSIFQEELRFLLLFIHGLVFMESNSTRLIPSTSPSSQTMKPPS